jgi:butyrate kinase
MARLTRTEKLAQIKEQQERLDAEKKALLAEIREADRKERTNRLCKRHGLLESLLSGTIKLNDKYYNEFIKKAAVTDGAKKILADLLDEQQLEAEIIADEQAKAAKPAAATPANVPQSGGAAQAANRANTEKQTA